MSRIVFSFKVEKLDPLTGQWMPCGESKTPECDVTGLQEGKEYKFRVKAVNKEGESEPLVAEKSIIAKNPYGKNGLIIFKQYYCLYLFLFFYFNENFYF